MVEHGTENAGVDSSILSLGTCVAWLPGSKVTTGGSGSVVEHLLAKEDVAGSNPVFRSNSIFGTMIKTSLRSGLFFYS